MAKEDSRSVGRERQGQEDAGEYRRAAYAGTADAGLADDLRGVTPSTVWAGGEPGALTRCTPGSEEQAGETGRMFRYRAPA